MPTLTRTTYVAVGGVALATAAYDLTDWSELLAEPEKRGEDYTVDGVAGATAVDRVRDVHRAICKVRVDGSWTSEGVRRAASAWHAGCYTNWAVLKALAEVTTTQTVELFVDGVSYASGDAYVDLSPPQGDARIWTGQMYFVLPLGALT